MDNNGAFTCSIAVNGGIPIADMGAMDSGDPEMAGHDFQIKHPV